MAPNEINFYNPKKIDGKTSNTTSANPYQPYLDPVSKALKDNSSVFGAAKQLQQSAGTVTSYVSTASNAKAEGNKALNDTQSFNELTKKLGTDGDTIKEKTSTVQANVTKDAAAVAKAGNAAAAANQEIASINTKITALQEETSSNPFEKPLETMYSLKLPSESGNVGTKTSDGLLSTTNQETEESSGSTENDGNKEKIAQLNSQKTQKEQDVKAETTKAKNIFDTSNQKLKVETNEINGKKQEVTKEIADAQKGQQTGTDVAGEGTAVESLGDMMIGSAWLPISAAGAVIKPIGTATNAAGIGLNLAATGALSQAQNKGTEIDKAAANISNLKQQAAETYVTALKKSKASNVA